ncbi:endonuclease V [Emticicia sp. 17c]|uniref:endonuclease V n=1 Tax=Emticicia sp. 17c TaxID=3127704 RepID=UPI00301BAA7D
MKIFKQEDLFYDKTTYQTLLGDEPFHGISYYDSNLDYYENGFLIFSRNYFNKKPIEMSFWYEGSSQVGYQFYFSQDKSNDLYLSKFLFWDFSVVIERFTIDSKGQIKSYGHIDDEENKISKGEWLNYREDFSDPKMFDFLPFYNQQNKLRERVLVEDELPDEIRHIAGVDVAYNEFEEKLVISIVILNAQTFQVLEEVIYEENVNYPYVPGLLPFRETPPVIAAFKKLTINPDLIICDGYGIAHPKGVGMATQLGIELNIPTIACARKRLIGYHDEPERTRSSNSPLQFDNKEVGKVLRTQDDKEPLFVSIGHKISIETACEWILRLTPTDRLPETTKAAYAMTSKIMKERTDWDTPLEFYLAKMKEQENGV